MDALRKLKEDNKMLMDLLQTMQHHICELEQEIINMPKVGRPEKYDAAFREAVREYCNAGHTYRDAAEHFSTSLATVGRILHVKE